MDEQKLETKLEKLERQKQMLITEARRLRMMMKNEERKKRTRLLIVLGGLVIRNAELKSMVKRIYPAEIANLARMYPELAQKYGL